MRVFFEENIERSDFIEIALTKEEYDSLLNEGVSEDFPDGLHGIRNLNVFVRVLKEREEFKKMPFKSKAQRAYLYSQEPEIAKEFAAHTSKEQSKKLPTRVKKTNKKKVSR